ncbi:MAG: outer membrane protein assembly factor [Lactobacillales bacterium]|jgi:hypothetical protein|nr:outer membrane protein assembly factor [Lactobacillales bacterium]
MRIGLKPAVFFLSFFLWIGASFAQPDEQGATEKRETIWFDPEDDYFDMSDFIINMHGFVPVPIVITEPAVGGFGLGVVPVFITPNKPIERDGKKYPVMPDMTMAGGAYTANKTWLVAGGKIGVIEKYGLQYKILGAYADAKLDFYEHLPRLNRDAKFKLDIKTTPVYLSLAKQLSDPRFTFGVDYLFAKVDVSPRVENSDIPQKWIRSFDSVLSALGILAEFDGRDNIFTPNKGIKASIHARASSKSLGSDFDYQTFEEALYWYHPVMPRWVSALRFDTQQITGSPPFYVKPFIDMRAVPSVKYQGDFTGLIETEQRFDIGPQKRWSVVGFAGAGKAFNTMNDFSDQKWVYSYGIGARYLLAKKLNLRVGLDIAKGRDGYAYYIVFGSSWMRQ